MAIQHNKEDGEEKAKPLVHLLVILFGITSWSIMNGLWVELPILVSHLPEGWTLPSYLTVSSQFGIIGPIIFGLLTWLFPKTKLETGTSILVLIVLSLSALLSAFFWQQTAHVAGGNYSVVLLALTVCQSIFAATSNMSYLAFLAHLRPRYMPSIFIGFGFSGLIPAFIAIAQGTGEIRCIPGGNITEQTSEKLLDVYGNTTNVTSYNFNNTGLSLVHINKDPDFSVRAFFLVLFAIGLVSLTSLLLLVYHPYCQTEHVDTDKEDNCQLMTPSSPEKETLTCAEETFSCNTGSLSAGVKSSTFPTQHELSTTQKADDRSFPRGEGAQEDTPMIDSGYDETKVNLNGFDPEKDTHSSNLVVGCLEEEGDLEVKIASQEKGGSKLQSVYRWLTSRKKTDRERRVVEGTAETKDKPSEACQGRQMSQFESWYLLGLLVWINALQTSYMLAIQVYSSLPYGLVIYDGVTKTENIVDPIACFLTMFVAAKSARVISGVVFLGTLFSAYIITVAAMSPHPFLEHDTMGGIIVIAAWTMCTMLMVFAKVCIGIVMRSQGRMSLMFTGATTQIGVFFGAMLAYCMINNLKLFKDGPWC